MASGTFKPPGNFIGQEERFIVGSTTEGELSFAQIQRAHKRKEPSPGDSIQLTAYYLDNGEPDNPDTYTENSTITQSSVTSNISITGWQSTKGIRYNTEGYYYIDNDDVKRTVTLSHIENIDKTGTRSGINEQTGAFNFADHTQFNQKIVSVTPANIDRIVAADEITGTASERTTYRFNAQEIHYDLDFGASGGDEVYYETVFGAYGGSWGEPSFTFSQRVRRGGENSMGVIATNVNKSTIGDGNVSKLGVGKVVKTWSFGGRGEAAGVLKYPGDEFAADNFGVGGLAAHRNKPRSLFRSSLADRIGGLFKGFRGFRTTLRLFRALFSWGRNKQSIRKNEPEAEDGNNFTWKVTSSDGVVDRPGILVGKERGFRRGVFQDFNLNRFTLFME